MASFGKTGGSDQFFEALKLRRSYYPLSNESTIPDARIQEIINQAVLHVPSSFNTQTTRVVLLLGDHHKKLWDITEEVLEPQVPDKEQFKGTQAKLAMFRGSYGSILFYEDTKAVNAIAAKFPPFADKFPQWSEHTNAMHQYAS
jgi:uncharacterized protein